MPPDANTRARRLPLLVGGALLGALALGVACAVLALAEPAAIEHRLRWIGIGAAPDVVFHDTMAGQLRRLDRNLEPGHALFFGDSHMQALDVTAIVPGAVNFGIGGDTSAELLERMQNYRSLATASMVVILVGTNDIRANLDIVQTVDHVRQMMALVPDGVPTFLVSVPPSGITAAEKLPEAHVRSLNGMLRAQCDGRCRYVDIYTPLLGGGDHLDPIYEEGDGIHLNPAGATVVRDVLRNAVAAATGHSREAS